MAFLLSSPLRFSLLMLVLAVFTLAAIVIACSAEDDDDGGISIANPSVRASDSTTSAVYFTIKNGGAADKLLSVSTGAAKVTQIHETVTDGPSTSMKQVEGVDVPAKGQVALSPGGYHVMLIDLTAPLVEGSTIELKLIFEKAGEMDVTVPVKSIAASLDELTPQKNSAAR
jgi:copper(I)-binding protein